MKKIIELAERYIHEGDSCPLQEALIKYKELQSTPITEEWLKEHGFKDESQERMLIYRKDTFGIECDLATCTTWEWYWANGDVLLSSLADLYDALELCGITMEDD